MDKNKNFKKSIKKFIEFEKRFIFFILSYKEKDSNTCYVCNKKLNFKNANILNIPTEMKTIFLCNHCMKKFNTQRKINERIFLNDKNNIKELKNNQIKLIPYMNSMILKISFAHKMWLDSQRRKYAERRNKNKS